MAGINVVFSQNEYIDHGSINELWHGPLEEGMSWIHNIRLVEVPADGAEPDLFVVLQEEDTHTQLLGIFLEDPRSDDFNRAGAQRVGGGYLGGHIREDGKLSLGTPYKAFSVRLAYIGSVFYLRGNCALRVDELPEDPSEYWEVDREAPIKQQGDAQSRQIEYQDVMHRVGGKTGEEVRKGHTAEKV